jgi:hypothetical protein
MPEIVRQSGIKAQVIGIESMVDVYRVFTTSQLESKKEEIEVGYAIQRDNPSRALEIGSTGR